jgi:hypothetical protein
MSSERIVKSFASKDGSHRAFIMGRDDGLYRFVEESMATDMGYAYWQPTHESGIYGTLADAEREARQTLPWLRDQISN